MINVSKLYCGQSGQSDDLRYGSDNSPGPVIVYNCTARCNLNCLHCYSSSTSQKAADELTTEQAESLLLQLKEINCAALLFSGGEPLLRQDLFDLLAEAEHLGLRSVISTNGTLIESDTAKRLADLAVSYVGISLDGSQQFHDEFRKTKGAFNDTMKGIENCHKANLRIGLRFTITKANLSQIPDLFDIASSMGVRRICFYHLISSGKAKDLYNQTPDTEETRRVMDLILERTSESVNKDLLDEVLTVGNHCDGPFLLAKMKSRNSKNYEQAKNLLLNAGGNKIGEKIGCVSWDGSVFADQFWRNYSLGNIKQKSFKQIWQDSHNVVLNKLRNKSEFADERCKSCKWFDLCRGNFRFLTVDAADKNWFNEPPCYLTNEEIRL
ncbi:radical SAM protein [Planctomycetota bacterium]